MRVYLSGMPELRLGLNDKVSIYEVYLSGMPELRLGLNDKVNIYESVPVWYA